MRAKQLLVLAAAVVGLGAFILLYERHQPSTEESKEKADVVFADLKRDDVVGLEVVNSHGAFKLVREGGRWLLTEPIAGAADDAAVGSLVGSLVELKRERTLTQGEVNPADYGLDQPKLSVALLTSGGGRRELKVGEDAALGGNRAVSLGGPEVILCSGWFVRDLDKGLTDWRSHEVVDVFADQLASFTLEAGSDRVHAVRVGDQWKLLEPLDDLADRDQLRNVVSDLNALRVQEFVDQADLAGLGLAPPRYRVTLVRADGNAPILLELGTTRQVDGKTQVACRRDGRDLLWVDDRAMTALGKAPVLWRSRAVYPFDSWDVEKASLGDGATRLAISRDSGVWRLPDGAEADSTAVSRRLSRLAELRATEFDLVAPTGGERGSLELELAADPAGGEPRRVSFTFYRALVDGGRALVRVSERSTVMAVDAAAVEEILGNLDQLRPAPTPAPVSTSAPG